MKASKQAVLDAKAKVKAEWVIFKELRNRRSNMAEMEIEIARLTKERDEARRERDETRREFCELCAPEWGLPSPQWLAQDKGWDCYKETP